MTGYNTQVPEYAYDPCGNNHESGEVNVVGQELNAYMAEDDQPPTASSQMLYNRLGASSEPIWPGSNESKLSVVSELIHLKAQYRIPNACYDDLCRIMQRLMPEDNVMPKNIYETKKLVRDMGFAAILGTRIMLAKGLVTERLTKRSGRTACPYCMEESEAFTLQHGGKQSWFDNHRKFLPHNHHFRRNTIAFRKEWFDPRPGVGTKINPKYPSLVEVNEKKRYSGNDIFVLATQATQVYYVNYPSLRRDKKDWLAVIKIKARAIVDIPVSNNVEPESTSDPYQDDEPESQPIQIVTNDEPELFIDDSATQLNIVDVEVEDEIQNEYFDLTEDD
ncbi:hypothetical protein V6N11_050488 [Hibiscus sabdariffa]|uniref:DUF4216 domain-containing protein n=2 Tax=Hibiscus sabdariffa TaxID=183260 RepID=A0ABR2TA42_9ROSI